MVTDLPSKTEVVLYHGLSALQKKFYKAILTKDLGMHSIIPPMQLTNTYFPVKYLTFVYFQFRGISKSTPNYKNKVDEYTDAIKKVC